jgi:hypothetical protein
VDDVLLRLLGDVAVNAKLKLTPPFILAYERGLGKS